eukprot:766550-Hanusia_phi.AAC.1
MRVLLEDPPPRIIYKSIGYSAVKTRSGDPCARQRWGTRLGNRGWGTLGPQACDCKRETFQA